MFDRVKKGSHPITKGVVIYTTFKSLVTFKIALLGKSWLGEEIRRGDRKGMKEITIKQRHTSW